jgi:hypothetical protein
MSAPRESLTISPHARLSVRVRNISEFSDEHIGKMVTVVTLNSLRYYGKLTVFADAVGSYGVVVLEMPQQNRHLAVLSSEIRAMEVDR